MEIISKIVEIETKLPTDDITIEKKLNSMGINPLRWAIVKVENEKLTISLACEKS